jgi:DNA-binding transcriptional LysR family regulator
MRTFTLRNSDGFVENFGPALIDRIGRDAPGVTLRIVRKLDKDSTPLRDGLVDLETGVIGGAIGPEVRAQALFRDHFVGVVRAGHPLASAPVTAELYATGRHVMVARRELKQGPIDTLLGLHGLERDVAATVDGFSAALAIVHRSDLIATVPERTTASLRAGLHCFPLPFAVAEITVSLLWHPRQDADPAHRWLRQCVREACTEPAVA